MPTNLPASSGLNLELTLNNPAQMPDLMMAIAAKQETTFAALQTLHFVHFARFLPTRDNTTLQVVTSFDGPLDAYALDFVIAIGDIFDVILGFVKDAPPLPVREHPQPFLAFVKQNNRVIVAPPALMWDNYPVYSAYPDKTVIDIQGPRKEPPIPRPVEPATVDLSDVQGNILKGYNAYAARHYSLRLQDGPAARQLLGRLVGNSGTEVDSSLPTITTAQPWTDRPTCMLNFGITAQGLKAMGVPSSMMSGFSNAFMQGAGSIDRANANGDTDTSSPLLWEIGGARTEVHWMLSLFAKERKAMAEFERNHQLLCQAFEAHHLTLVHQHDAIALPDGHVQFGYKDGISQPRLAGVTQEHADNPNPDMQPLASVGEFLLGKQYKNVYNGASIEQMPEALCTNGTFAAIRVLDQDVAQFESLLDTTARDHWVGREWVAAKLMGRWRDGRPLLPPPVQTSPGCPVPHGLLAFDYAPSLAYPNSPADNEGIGCPIGSHIRRMNPRSSLVAGQPYSRRLIRRGMPYGPAWSPAEPNVRRGLFGVFICGDLERQFEFLTQQWANSDFAASGIRGTQDPIIGAQTLTGEYAIPMPDGQAPIQLKTPRLVTTRGSLYLLMPGISGLKWLAQGEGFDNSAAKSIGPAQWLSEPPAVQTDSRLVPAQFDPMDPDFLDNPYPYYQLFRRHAPVVKVLRGDYQSYWIMSHELCQQAALDPATYLKQTTQTPLTDRGLFFMDDPQHGEARQAIDPQFLQAIQAVNTSAKRKSERALAQLQSNRFDLVTDYATPVLRDVFMDMFGWPEAQWETLGELIEVMLAAFNPMLPLDERTPSYAAAGQIMQLLQSGMSRCPAHQTAAAPASADPLGLFCRMQKLVGSPALNVPEFLSSSLDFLLGGYLSSAFLVSTGVANLLKHPAAMSQYRTGNAQLRSSAFEEMKRFDAPFQLADRYAAKDLTLGGVMIPKDSLISLVYGSANHDEAIFGATAEVFNIERASSLSGANLVFGIGEHRCIGAPMAEQVVPLVIDTLLEQTPNLSLIARSPQQQRDDPYFRGFRSLLLSR